MSNPNQGGQTQEAQKSNQRALSEEQGRELQALTRGTDGNLIRGATCVLLVGRGGWTAEAIHNAFGWPMAAIDGAMKAFNEGGPRQLRQYNGSWE